jgi:uroporphyrinogen-III synthase
MPNSINEKTYALFADSGNKKIVAELENAGAQIIEFPPLATEKIEPGESSVEQLSRLKSFDWIIFPDVLSVDFFLQTLEENAVDFFELDEIRVCALGEVVSDRLRFAQLHADVIPSKIKSEDVLSALKNYIAAEDFKNLKFLLPKERSFESDMKKQLIQAGAEEVCDLPVYQIKVSKENEFSKLKALVKGGAIDEFVFTSPTDFIYLNYIFGGEPLARVLSGIVISAADGNVYQTIRENNLKCGGLFQTDKIVKVDE